MNVDEPTPENHEEKCEGEKPQSLPHYQISLTVLVIGYALGKIAMLFSCDVFFAPMPDAAFYAASGSLFMGSQWLNNRSAAANFMRPYR
ncbi:hypothetical protein AWN70_25585 [Escherichia coli]|nr:hypothetical protein AWN70_25585 [Escherichia coli]